VIFASSASVAGAIAVEGALIRRRMGPGMAALAVVLLGWVWPAAALGRGSVVISAEPEDSIERKADHRLGPWVVVQGRGRKPLNNCVSKRFR
jgi:hypothetical protein